jgi:hypothetical protein
MTAPPCKSCGHVQGRLSALRRGTLYRELIALLAQWKAMATGDIAPPVNAVDEAGQKLALILADDQGLCVACADEVQLP